MLNLDFLKASEIRINMYTVDQRKIQNLEITVSVRASFPRSGH